jgi:glucan phosphorylase
MELPRSRWLRQSNRDLSDLITDKIGEEWVTDLDQLKKIEKFTRQQGVHEEVCRA